MEVVVVLTNNSKCQSSVTSVVVVILFDLSLFFYHFVAIRKIKLFKANNT